MTLGPLCRYGLANDEPGRLDLERGVRANTHLLSDVLYELSIRRAVEFAQDDRIGCPSHVIDKDLDNLPHRPLRRTFVASGMSPAAKPSCDKTHTGDSTWPFSRACPSKLRRPSTTWDGIGGLDPAAP